VVEEVFYFCEVQSFIEEFAASWHAVLSDPVVSIGKPPSLFGGTMFENPSLFTRIAVGKLVGMALGLVGLMTIPYLWPDLGWMERIGFLLWYTTVGAVIGIFGVINCHPILRLPMPWWFRSTLIGAWMNFVLTLFIYDALTVMLVDLFGENSAFLSPFLFVAEGALVGLIIGFFATRLGGEGPETVGREG
jgi:hypothetical protein